jgi:hypothetical protein
VGGANEKKGATLDTSTADAGSSKKKKKISDMAASDDIMTGVEGAKKKKTSKTKNVSTGTSDTERHGRSAIFIIFPRLFPQT